MDDHEVEQIRTELLRNILSLAKFDEQTVHQWCLMARDTLVAGEMPCKDADRQVLSTVIGSLDRNQFESVRVLLEWKDPPEPKWQQDCKANILLEAKRLYLKTGKGEFDEQDLVSMTSVFNQGVKAMLSKGDVSRRVAVESLSERIKKDLPKQFVDKLMLEIQIRSFAQRFAKPRVGTYIS